MEDNLKKKLMSRLLLLDKGIIRNQDLLVKNIDYKRSFCTTLILISSTTIIGLLALFFSDILIENNLRIYILIIIGLFAIFILWTTIYFSFLLSQENSILGDRIKFGQSSREKLINKINNGDIKNFDDYCESERKEENKLNRRSIFFEREIYFKITIFMFVLPWFLLMGTFFSMTIHNKIF